MRTSESTDKIMPAYLAARSEIFPAAKGGENTFDHYRYATEFDWHRAAMPILLKHRLCLAFSVGESTVEPTTSKKGDPQRLVVLRGSARLIHESGQYIEVDCIGEGIDRSDKAAYKAQTGLKKYGYALLLALPTTDDPERPDADEAKAEKRDVQQNGSSRAKYSREFTQSWNRMCELAKKRRIPDAKDWLTKRVDSAIKAQAPDLGREGLRVCSDAEIFSALESEIARQIEAEGTY